LRREEKGLKRREFFFHRRRKTRETCSRKEREWEGQLVRILRRREEKQRELTVRRKRGGAGTLPCDEEGGKGLACTTWGRKEAVFSGEKGCEIFSYRGGRSPIPNLRERVLPPLSEGRDVASHFTVAHHFKVQERGGGEEK